MINYTYRIDGPGAPVHHAHFWELVRELGLYHWQRDRWPCDLASLPDELANASSERAGDCQSEGATCRVELAEGGVAAIQSVLGGGYVEVTGAAASREAAGSALAWARELLPPAVRDDPKRVPIIFWFARGRRPATHRRMLDVPRWPEIEANYAAETRRQLDGLMDGFVPAKGGQLLLFHGQAGTGKTFALRALASEWRSWCDIDYVIDPDKFLGEAQYLVEVLLARRSEWEGDFDPSQLMGDLFGRMGLGGGPSGPPDPDRWRLIVLEDTGELLSADAKERTGQSLSRLLNTVDGLIGQGLRALILVTTNEPIRELHPAVARAGRCAAAIEFLPLSGTEASAWLGHAVTDDTTIADLYALRDGYRGAHADLAEEAGLEV